MFKIINCWNENFKISVKEMEIYEEPFAITTLVNIIVVGQKADSVKIKPFGRRDITDICLFNITVIRGVRMNWNYVSEKDHDQQVTWWNTNRNTVIVDILSFRFLLICQASGFIDTQIRSIALQILHRYVRNSVRVMLITNENIYIFSITFYLFRLIIANLIVLMEKSPPIIVR